MDDLVRLMGALAEELPRTLPKRAVLGVEMCRTLLAVMTAEEASRLVITATALSACLDFLSGLAVSPFGVREAARLCVLFELLLLLVQSETLDEAVVLRLAESCLAPVFAATAAAAFAARVVCCLFDRYEMLQSALLEACLGRQWPVEVKPSYRLLPPCKGSIHQASALILEMVQTPEYCASVVAALFDAAHRPTLLLLLNDAMACLGVQPNAAQLLLAASAKCAHHATSDPWALEMLGSIVAAVAQVTTLPGDAGECVLCNTNTDGAAMRVQCSRCKQHYHGSCVSLADERVQTLGQAGRDERSRERDDWTCRACLVRRHALSATTPTFTNVILAALKEKSPKLRMRAVRCLMAVLQVKRQLLERPDVTHAIKSRFFDQNVSVRDAVVDLTGSCAPFVFFAEISDRALDTGLSVRKRAVRVLARIACQAEATPQRRAALVTLAGRLRDDKSVKTLAREAFEKAWFGEWPSPPDRVAEMASVVKSANGAAWFVPLVRKLVKRAAAVATTKKSAAPSVQSVCEALCDALVQHGTAESLLLLRLLADIVPAYLTAHLHVLRASLDRSTADVVYIIERIMAHSVHHEFVQLQELEVEMVKIVYNNAETAVVASAIRSLVGAVSITKHVRIMCDLYAKIYGFLHQTYVAASANKLAPERHAALIRALFTMGNLLRWFDFDTFDGVPATLSTPVHAIAKEELHARVLRLCLFFAGSSMPVAIRSRAIEAAGNVCARSAEFLIMCTDLLRSALAEGQQSPEVLSRALTLVLHHLQEEKRVYQERTRKNRPDGQDDDNGAAAEGEGGEDFYDGTASVSATVVNEHLAAVLKLTGFADASVRGAALALVAEALSQGLVQGTVCVAPLMALLADEPVRAEAALAVLTTRAAKSKGFLEQMVSQLGPGVSSAFALARRIAAPDAVLKSASQVLAGLFRAVREQAKTRNLFLNELVTWWENALARDTIEVPLLNYLATAMAYIPFNSEHGPLLMCYHMNRIVALRAQDVKETDDYEEADEEPASLAQALSLSLQLKMHYKALYKISSAKLHSFLPHKPGPDSKGGAEMAAALKAPDFDTTVPLRDMLDASEDFNTEAMLRRPRRGGAARKRAPAKRGRTGPAKSKGKHGGKKKRAAKEEEEEEEEAMMLDEEEEEEEEEEMYDGAPRD